MIMEFSAPNGDIHIIPMFPRLRDHFGEGNVKSIRDKDRAMTHLNSQWQWLPAHDQDSQNFKWLRENLTKIHLDWRTQWQMMTVGGETVGFPQKW